MIETYATDSMMNGSYDVSSGTKILRNDFTKGFIVCGWDANGFICQSNLGASNGSLGFVYLSFNFLNSELMNESSGEKCRVLLYGYLIKNCISTKL